MEVSAIILCAGKGSRMKCDSPKVIQKILGYEMVNHVLASLNSANIKDNSIVVGYKKDEVLACIDDYQYNIIQQEEQLGTGDAIKACSKAFSKKSGIVIVINGDTPLIRPETFKSLIKKHNQEENTMTILTTNCENPYGYGRILRNDVGSVSAIIEEKDASYKEKQISEINSGIYCFNVKDLFKYVGEIKNNNKQKEYYLTDLVTILNNHHKRVGAYCIKNMDEIKGINDLVSLNEANKILQKRINSQLQLNGVNIVDSDSTFIGPKVKIGKNVVIEPNNILIGDIKIGNNTYLKQGNTIVDSKIGKDCLIGPQAHIHTNSVIGNSCKVGNFVEMKKSRLGNNTKAAHLTYLGDSIIGNNVNIGCGVITANYDGKTKHQTIIKDNCFIGSNVTLIAPITVKKDCLVAAGSTISLNELPANKLVIARNREVIKPRKK